MVMICILMPVYNGERYIQESVESILDQSFTEYQFIVINDGSTDCTRSTLEGYTDSRLHIINNVKNQGAYFARNQGIGLAKSRYIAFMDADDVSLPHRLERQIAFLEGNPEIGLLGCHCRIVDEDGRDQGVYQVPISDLQIRWTCMLANPFAAPTVMLRRDVLVQNHLLFDTSFHVAGDYDLWARMLKYSRAANLPDLLVKYRLGAGLTSTQRETQLRNHDAIAQRTIGDYLSNFEITHAQVSQLRALFVGGESFVSDEVDPLASLLKLYIEMFQAFQRQYSVAADMRALQRAEASRITRQLLRSPFSFGWIPVIWQLIVMYFSSLR